METEGRIVSLTIAVKTNDDGHAINVGQAVAAFLTANADTLGIVGGAWADENTPEQVILSFDANGNLDAIY